MSQINLGRVVIGGLLAGLIINVGEFILNGLLLEEQMNAAMAALNKPPINPNMIMWFVLFGFGLGCMLVWTYAAIRPRFGAGVKTAICASIARVGPFLSLPESLHGHHQYLSDEHDGDGDGLGSGRSRTSPASPAHGRIPKHTASGWG